MLGLAALTAAGTAQAEPARLPDRGVYVLLSNPQPHRWGYFVMPERRQGASVDVWSVDVFTTPNRTSRGDQTVGAALYRYDCVTRRLHFVSGYALGANRQVLADIPGPGAPESITAGTEAEYIVRFACDGEPLADPTFDSLDAIIGDAMSRESRATKV